MRFELSKVEFDGQGEPCPAGRLDDPVKSKWMQVLYDGDDWLGPVWKRDERNNLVALDHKELVRMHWYAYERIEPDVTTERLQADNHDEGFYLDEDGRERPVPTLDGQSIRNIPMK